MAGDDQENQEDGEELKRPIMEEMFSHSVELPGGGHADIGLAPDKQPNKKEDEKKP